MKVIDLVHNLSHRQSYRSHPYNNIQYDYGDVLRKTHNKMYFTLSNRLRS